MKSKRLTLKQGLIKTSQLLTHLQVGKFGGKGKGGGLQHASNHSSVSGLDQLNMSDKDINVSTAVEYNNITKKRLEDSFYVFRLS